jgi:hypothetical protein
LRLFAAEEADVEEDSAASERGHDEGGRAADAEPEQAEPDDQREADAPQAGLNSLVDARGSQVHGAMLFGRAEGAADKVKGPRKCKHPLGPFRRTGFASVHCLSQLSASAYDCPVPLRPTRVPCSAQEGI